jgi:hypothetical protein
MRSIRVRVDRSAGTVRSMLDRPYLLCEVGRRDSQATATVLVPKRWG